MSTFYIDNQTISFEEIEHILHLKQQVALGENAKAAIVKCRSYLDKKMENSDRLIYGINTGFGSLCNTAVSNDDLEQLQRNLVLSHACGMGEEVPAEIIRIMLLFKVLGLSKGHSGVQLATVERLLFFYNEGIFPVVYQQGSLGASGDLAPLAHLCLPLLGEGEFDYQGQRYQGADLKRLFDIEPIVLRSKEGLALLNGTQFMSSFGFYCLSHGLSLWNKWNHVAAMSLDAYDGRINPFQENVNVIRNQSGQIETAAHFRSILSGSEILQQEKVNVQDPYSFRCIPQVHGASRDTLLFAKNVLEKEINAVTDNPTIFPDEDDVVSAGNFHGQPLALVMDYLAIALAELGSISERRIYKLISGTRGLPAFLVANPGLNSGLMIAQYACAAIVSQNKQLCTPASVDTIDSSNGQEDHVSMGANAATKLYRVLQNCYSVIGIELFNAAQALEFRRPLTSSTKVEAIFTAYRQEVSFYESDRNTSKDMQQSVIFIKNSNPALWK